MKTFNIKKDATMPYLEMIPISDGRNDFGRLYTAIQSAKVTFSMINEDTGVKKIANAPVNVIAYGDGSCTDKFKLQYKWKKRDTNEAGRFMGKFKIVFDGEIATDGEPLPSGELIVPIQEDLMICISN